LDLRFPPELASDLVARPEVVDFVEVVAETCFTRRATRCEACALAEPWAGRAARRQAVAGSAGDVDPCSKGTYVRSLVADIGTALGPGAHLADLRRTRSGKFTIEQAVPLDRLAQATLIPPAQATDLPSVTVPRALVAQVMSGVKLPVTAFGAGGLARFQLVDEAGRLLAIAHPRPAARSTCPRPPRDTRVPSGRAQPLRPPSTHCREDRTSVRQRRGSARSTASSVRQPSRYEAEARLVWGRIV
jgi:hypothetical protein